MPAVASTHFLGFISVSPVDWVLASTFWIYITFPRRSDSSQTRITEPARIRSKNAQALLHFGTRLPAELAVAGRDPLGARKDSAVDLPRASSSLSKARFLHTDEPYESAVRLL